MRTQLLVVCCDIGRRARELYGFERRKEEKGGRGEITPSSPRGLDHACPAFHSHRLTGSALLGYLEG